MDGEAKTQGDPAQLYAPEPSIIERRAADLLARYRVDGEARSGADARARALTRATRWAVGLAIVAGILSGGLIGGSEIWLREAYDLDDRDFWEALPFWIGWFAAAGVVSAVEIAFLYWVALKGIARILGEARVELGESGYPGLLASGFARGALEFPNPRAEIWDLDPYAYVPRWRLLARSVAYKMKVGVSSFILRVFMRRVATRLAIRGFVPLLAGPLYAAWNAFIIWRVMTEARVRAFGPPAIDAALARLDERAGEEAQAVVAHGIGEMVRRAGDMHPNYVYLVARLRDRGIGVGADGADWSGQRRRLEALDDAVREDVLRLLVLASVLGTRTHGKQRAIVEQAMAAAGHGRGEVDVKALRRALVEGRLAVPDSLDAAMAG